MHTSKLCSIFVLFFCLAFVWFSIALAEVLVPWDFSQEQIDNAEISINAALGRDWEAAYHYADLSDNVIKDLVEWIKIQQDCEERSVIDKFFRNHPNWPRERSIKGVFVGAVDSISAIEYECDGLTKKSVFLNRQIMSSESYFEYVGNLLWQKKVEDAKKTTYLLPEKEAKIVRARIALQRNLPKVESYLEDIPDQKFLDIGLANDYLYWRIKQHGPDQESLDLLISVQDKFNDDKRRWRINRFFIQDVLYRKNSNFYNQAYALAKLTIKSKDMSVRSESLWLAGWIALNNLKNLSSAYSHFVDLYKISHTPYSVSKAAYWAGKTSEELGRVGMASRWYKISSIYQTTFYGQISLFKTGIKHINLMYDAKYSSHDYLNCHNNIFAKISYIAFKAKNQKISDTFMYHAIESSKSPGEVGIITELSLINDMPSVAIWGAMALEVRGVTIPNSLYPVHQEVNGMEDIDKELVFSIIRQESKFNHTVKGLAGEFGLMQIMPGTAKAIAKDIGINYKENKMLNPKYNVTLGYAYLKKMLQQFNNSLILGFAAYNAGPTNVNKWIKNLGDPRKFSNTDDLIKWIEMIPFSGTRDYVQHAIGNLQVYSSLLAREHNVTPTNYLSRDFIR